MRSIALAVIALVLGSCATVVNGFNEEFVVETVPPGASVATSLDDGNGRRATSCAPTPCSIPVSRKDQFIARVTLPDHHDVRVVVRSSEFVRAEIDDVRLMQEAIAEESSGSALATAGASGVAAGLGGVMSANLPLLFVSSNTTMAVGLASFYGSPILAGADGMTGAKLSLYPNPVKLVMVPDSEDVPDTYRFRSLPDDEELLVLGLNSEAQPDAAP